MICRYVALFVPDLRGAEDFYRHVFGMELLFREGAEEGRDYALPAESAWDELGARGVRVDMLALRRGDFVLPLFQGTPTPGTVLELCLALAQPEIDRVRERLPESVTVLAHEEGFLHFDDPFGFRWTLQQRETAFVSLLPPLPDE